MLLFLAGTAFAAERNIVRTFPIGPGCTVTVDSYRGAINVAESDANEVRVAIHLEIGSETEAEAERMLQTLDLNVSGDATSVSVVARRPAETRARFVWNETKQIEPTYRVTVPRACNLTLKTISGSIIVGNIKGQLSATSETGDVFFRHVGGTVSAATQTGDVVVSHCEGLLTARVRNGAIRIGTVTGRCDVKNASGSVEIMAAKTDLKAYAEAGDATIGVPRDFTGQADVTTSGGNIIMKIDPAANCRVDASTSLLGRVETRLPLAIESGERGRRKLVGRLNRADARLVLRASGGNIDLLLGESPFE